MTVVASGNHMVAASRPVAVLASFDTTTPEGMKRAFNACNGADEKLSDHIGDAITITDFFVEPIEMVSNETGEVTYVPHIVLYTEDGMSYDTISKGVQSCIDRMTNLNMVGAGKSVTVTIKERKAGRGRMLYLEMI